MSLPSMPGPDDHRALQEEVALLRSSFGFFLRLQLVFILAVGVFVWRAALVQHRSLEAARLGSGKIRNEQIRQQQIVEEFRRYGSTHPEFAQILKAKGIDVPSAPAGGNLAPARPPAGR